MKSIFRATAILGSSSFINILIGLFSSKVYAVLLGPSGVGFMGLVQSLFGLSTMIAGMGIGVGLVRMGAAALGKDASRGLEDVAVLRQAAMLVVSGLGCLTLILLLAFRIPLSSLMLGGTERAGSIGFIGIALLFNLAAGVQTSTLNAHHRVEALAKCSVFSSIANVSAGVPLIWFWHEEGIAPALAIGAITGCVVAQLFVRRELGRTSPRPARSEVLKSSWSLLKFGAPYTASMIVGTGVQLMLPVMALHTLGEESVGFYRASTTIASGYLGFLLLAMGQDYYPRLSAVSHRPDALAQLVNQQHRLIMLLGVPLILGVLALAPYIVPLVYSEKFYPTVDLLEWQLLGDVFKFSSWTMAFVILARTGSSTYFLTESVAGATTLCTAWLGMRWFGLIGLGLGYLATYIVYYVAVWMIVRKEIGLLWTPQNKLMLGGAVLAGATVQLLPFLGLDSYKTIIALTFALLASIGSAWAIRAEFVSIKFSRAIPS
jgi:O-antigen/teichoic acid export membrane protein